MLINARAMRTAFLVALPPASLRFGPLAQLVEQLTLNQLVRSSNLRRPTSTNGELRHRSWLPFFVGATPVLPSGKISRPRSTRLHPESIQKESRQGLILCRVGSSGGQEGSNSLVTHGRSGAKPAQRMSGVVSRVHRQLYPCA